VLLVLPEPDILRLGIGEDQAHGAAGPALVLQNRDQLRMLLGQEVEREPEQIDLLPALVIIAHQCAGSTSARNG
jgi:hypothetical protein